MNVTLTSHTHKPTTTCAIAAKTCTSDDPHNHSDRVNLVKRVLAMGHESIAEHANFTFVIEGISRACSHQLVRYRHASFAQQSQRYVEGVPEFVVPESIANNVDAWAEFELVRGRIEGTYDRMVNECGIPPEDARYILPNAVTTNITVTVNAAELRHMMRQRLCNRAQWEIRALVGEMAERARAVAPVLFEGVGPACLNGKCPEGKLSCGKPWK